MIFLPKNIKWIILASALFFTFISKGQTNKTYAIIIDSLPIQEALFSLSEQTKIPIIYSSNSFLDSSKIYIDETISIEQALIICLKNSGNIFKRKHGKYIIIPSVKTNRLSGFVEDAENGERLIGAYIGYNYQYLSTTNEYGFFSVEIPDSIQTIQFSYIGYHPYSVSILDKLKPNSIQLRRNTNLNTVIITDSLNGNSNSDWIISTDVGIKVDKIQDEQVGTLAGEKDITQKLQLITGVQAFPDALGGWHIRGGGTEQNQILVDGAQIYNPSHALGLLSIFNGDAIRHQKLYKGNMPAEYGGFTSSALELYTKEGNLNHYQGKLSIGLMSAKFQFEGPIKKDKIAFFISGRKSTIDPFVKKISARIKSSNDIVGNNTFSMYDVNAKLNFILNNNNRIYLSFYKGGDLITDQSIIEYSDLLSTYKDTDNGDYQWGNTVASMRWNHILSAKSFGNLNLTYSSFKYRNEVYNIDKVTLFNNVSQIGYYTNLSANIEDVSLKWDIDILYNKRHRIESGAQLTYRNFNPGVYTKEFNFSDFSSAVDNDSIFNLEEFQSENRRLKAFELAIYIKDQYQIKDIGALQFGLRFNLHLTNNRVYFNPEPRINLQLHSKNKTWYWTSTFTKSTQFSHLLSPNEGGLPSDLWVPVTNKIKPQHAWLASTGFKYFNPKAVNIEFESFYKRLYNQLLFDPNRWLNSELNASESNSNWEEQVLIGKGWAAGSELSIERNTDQYKMFIGYTLSWSKRQYDALNQGQYFAYRFDRRHDFSIAFSYNINKNFSLYGNWFIGSGYPITLSRNRFTLLSTSGNVIDDFNENDAVNSYRLKPYHRLDIGLNINWQKPKVAHEFQIGVYNLYNRKNAIGAYLQVNASQPWLTNIKETSLINILPSVSYSLSFGKYDKK